MIPDMSVGGDWGEYRRLVLKEIESLHVEVEKLKGITGQLQGMVTELKVRISVYAALIAAGASVAVTWILNNLRFS